MITAEKAYELTQKRNRDCWINDSLLRLEFEIINAANNGLKKTSIEIKNLIVGAENISEMIEMLYILDKVINLWGYKTKISLGGCYEIFW